MSKAKSPKAAKRSAVSRRRLLELETKLLRVAEHEILELIRDASNRLFRLHGARNDIWRELEAMRATEPEQSEAIAPARNAEGDSA
jgi:hypothetical protein